MTPFTSPVLQPDELALPADNEFRRDTIACVRGFQEAMRAAVGFRVGDNQKIRQIQEKFELNLQTGWQVYRIVNAEDPLDATPHIPVPGAMKRLAGALRKVHPTGGLVSVVEQTYDAFAKHVVHYAGDRAFFDAMVAQLVGGDAESQLELEHRRAVFEANRFIRGIETEKVINTEILAPSHDMPDAYDMVYLSLNQGLRRLKPSAPMIVRSWQVADHSKGPTPLLVDLHPLDQVAAQRYGMPLLPAFCSVAEPPLTSYETPTGLKTEWVSTTVGQPSTIDIAFGEYMRHRPLRSVHAFGFYRAFDTPVKLYVRDLLLHRETFPALEQETTRWNSPGMFHKDTGDRLAPQLMAAGYTPLECRDNLIYLGNGAAVANIAEAPTYVNMLRDTCSRMKWNLEDLAVYRLQVDYPLMHSFYMTRVTVHRAAGDQDTIKHKKAR